MAEPKSSRWWERQTKAQRKKLKRMQQAKDGSFGSKAKAEAIAFYAQRAANSRAWRAREKLKKVMADQCVSQRRKRKCTEAPVQRFSSGEMVAACPCSWLDRLPLCGDEMRSMLTKYASMESIKPAIGNNLSVVHPLKPAYLISWDCDHGHYHPRLWVKRSGHLGHGMGLYVHDGAQPSDLLTKYVGVKTASNPRNLESGCFTAELYTGKKKVLIDASGGSVYLGAHFINHSSDPGKVNCTLGRDGGIYASKDIDSGEELLMDYGSTPNFSWNGTMFHSASGGTS